MSQSLMIGGSFESYKYIEDILLKMAATTSHESSSFLEMIQDENHANLVILHIPIFSLALSTHSTNPLPVSAHAWLSKTPQIHPPTLIRTCKSGHLSHTHFPTPSYFSRHLTFSLYTTYSSYPQRVARDIDMSVKWLVDGVIAARATRKLGGLFQISLLATRSMFRL